MSKHTPGPWEVKEDDRIGRTIITSQRIGLIAILADHDIGAEEWAQDEANARLIAAAPELLSVCEILHVRLFREQGGQENSPWAAPLELLRKVIAKANPTP